jgi:hypothetical protein
MTGRALAGRRGGGALAGRRGGGAPAGRRGGGALGGRRGGGAPAGRPSLPSGSSRYRPNHDLAAVPAVHSTSIHATRVHILVQLLRKAHWNTVPLLTGLRGAVGKCSGADGHIIGVLRSRGHAALGRPGRNLRGHVVHRTVDMSRRLRTPGAGVVPVVGVIGLDTLGPVDCGGVGRWGQGGGYHGAAAFGNKLEGPGRKGMFLAGAMQVKVKSRVGEKQGTEISEAARG